MALGSIVVRLTMNTADFETDAGRAAKVAERRAKQIDDAFKKAGTAIGLALGAALVGVGKALKDGIDRMDELSKSAQKVSMPTEQFSQLAYAGELADVSMETLVSSLGRLTKSQAAAMDGASEQAKWFEALEISVSDAAGAMRPASDVLADFADRFAALKGSPEAMAAGFGIFGRSFQEMIPLLKDGSAGLREAAAESDRLNKTVGTEAGKAAEEFNDNLTRMQGVLAGVTLEVASRLLPSLVDVSGKFVDTATNGDKVKEVADSLVAGFNVLAGAAHVISSAFELVGTGIATVVAQGQAAVKFLTGDLRGAMALYSTASAGFGAELDEALGRGGQRTQGSRPPIKIITGDGLLAEDRRQAAEQAAARAQAERIRKLLGETSNGRSGSRTRSGGGGKSRAAELTEEQKAAQRLQEQYKQLIATADERIALVGVESEVTKLAYELQNGELSKLTQLQKDELMVRALKLEAMEGTRKQIEEEAEAMERQREVYEQILGDLQFEAELLGKTREEQEILNNLRYAGVEANSAYGQSIIEATKSLQDQRRAVEESVEVQDVMRASFEGLFTDLISGTKSAKDAFKDFAASVLADISRIIAKRMVEQLFGQPGSTETGSSGINWGQIFGSFFGGQRASGGPVRAGKLYEVGEGNRPELLSMSGRTYLIPGNEGRVTPAASSGVGGVTQIFNQTYRAPTDPRTRQQVAADIGFQTRRAAVRG